MGYYNVSPNYKLSTSTISKSLLESTRFNQWISLPSGSSTCYAAFISVSRLQSLVPTPPPPLSAATMASLYFWWLCMCLTSAQCVVAANVCACVHPDDIIGGPVGCMTCFNQCPGQRIEVSALYRALSHQVNPFWFLRAPSMSVFFFSSGTTWESGGWSHASFPPFYALFTSETPPALQMAFINCDLKTPWEISSCASKANREKSKKMERPNLLHVSQTLADLDRKRA